MTYRTRWLVPILGIILSGCASTNIKSTSTAGNLIVVGTLEEQEYLGSLDEFGMSGVIAAKLRVTRVVRGEVPSRVIKIRYIAHTFRDESERVRMRLILLDDDIYGVCREEGAGYNCD